MHTLKEHFISLAKYSGWANNRLSENVKNLPEDLVNKNVGIYFKTVYLTLTHLLQSDRAWKMLLSGETLANLKLPPAPESLDKYISDRKTQDESFTAWVEEQIVEWFERPFLFQSAMQSWKGLTWEGTNAGTLGHVLNHQTHHRGQVHAALTILGVEEPSALDILVKGMLKE